MELTFKTIGMSYWDFDVMTRQFKAFNDLVNDYHPERAITPERLHGSGSPGGLGLYRQIHRAYAPTDR